MAAPSHTVHRYCSTRVSSRSCKQRRVRRLAIPISVVNSLTTTMSNIKLEPQDESAVRKADEHSTPEAETHIWGCVYDNCFETFSSAAEWKWHDATHRPPEDCYRCHGGHLLAYGRGRPCHALFKYAHKEGFKLHCGIAFPRAQDLEDYLERCYLPSDNSAKFWCGFCYCPITFDPGSSAPVASIGTLRTQHIEAHFLEGLRADSWMELAAKGLTKGYLKQPLWMRALYPLENVGSLLRPELNQSAKYEQEVKLCSTETRPSEERHLLMPRDSVEPRYAENARATDELLRAGGARRSDEPMQSQFCRRTDELVHHWPKGSPPRSRSSLSVMVPGGLPPRMLS